jgi:hypothetical protein
MTRSCSEGGSKSVRGVRIVATTRQEGAGDLEAEAGRTTGDEDSLHGEFLRLGAPPR